MSSSKTLLRALIDLATPVIGINVLAVLALAVDTAMCGRLADHEVALIGLGYAVQVSFVLMVAMIGLSVGTVATIARAWGAGDRLRAQHVLEQSTWLTLALAVIVAIVGNLVAEPMLRALGGTDATVAAGLSYLRVSFNGAAFAYLNVLWGAALRGVGNTRLAFVVMLVVNALNVVFNYALIFGHWGAPAMGLRGAALGTIAAQACGAALMFGLLTSGRQDGLGRPLRRTPLDREVIAQVMRVGWPAAADMVVVNAMFLSVIGMLGRVDETAVAAHGIGLRVQALAFVPGMSIAQAAAALVGQALGAGDRDRAYAVVRLGVACCVATMTAFGAIIVVFAYPLVGLFDIPRDSELARLSVQWMRVLGAAFPLTAIGVGFSGMFQGSGRTREGLRINAWSTFLWQIPLSFLLGFPAGLGTLGIWGGFPASAAVRAVASWRVYRRGDWATPGRVAR